jgi:hypothetical protein
VDGGPNYLQGFTSPPSRFPLGLWLQCAGDVGQATADKATGVNLYVAICGTAANIDSARSAGMQILLQNDSGLKPFPTDSVNAGYMVGDEWDMTHPASDCSGVWQTQKNAFPADGRLKYANFGKGVNFWNTNAQAACWVNSVDVPSTDEYWMSDNNVCGPGEAGGKPGVVTANNCHVPANYGWNVNRVRSLVSPARSKATWSFVEIGCPFADAGWPCVRTAEMRAATWHSIIAGAMGIAYFAHSFKGGAGNGTCTGSPTATQRDCPAVRTALTNLNAEIQGLAPVLNAPYLTSGFSANANVRALAKFSDGKFYVIAGAAGFGGPFTGNFSIPCVGDATATVLGESRMVRVTAGAWSDSFADMNAVHVYRLDGGSTCGLT